MHKEANIESHAAALSCLGSVRLFAARREEKERVLSDDEKLEIANEKKQAVEEMSQAEDLYYQQHDPLNVGYGQGLNDIAEEFAEARDTGKGIYYYSKHREYLLRNPDYKMELMDLDRTLAAIQGCAVATPQGVAILASCQTRISTCWLTRRSS
jgi:hypothetical protein